MTAPFDATIQAVLSTFATELLARRTRIGWSRERLVQEAGVALATVERIEKGTTGSPKRTSIIDLSFALQRAGVWTVAEALSAADEPPLADYEQAAIAASDPKDRIDQLWPKLTQAAKWALLYSAELFADPAAQIPTREPTIRQVLPGEVDGSGHHAD